MSGECRGKEYQCRVWVISDRLAARSNRFRVSGANRNTRFGMRDISDLASRITCSYWVLFGFRYSKFGFCFVGYPVP